MKGVSFCLFGFFFANDKLVRKISGASIYNCKDVTDIP